MSRRCTSSCRTMVERLVLKGAWPQLAKQALVPVPQRDPRGGRPPGMPPDQVVLAVAEWREHVRGFWDSFAERHGIRDLRHSTPGARRMAARAFASAFRRHSGYPARLCAAIASEFVTNPRTALQGLPWQLVIGPGPAREAAWRFDRRVRAARSRVAALEEGGAQGALAVLAADGPAVYRLVEATPTFALSTPWLRAVCERLLALTLPAGGRAPKQGKTGVEAFRSRVVERALEQEGARRPSGKTAADPWPAFISAVADAIAASDPDGWVNRRTVSQRERRALWDALNAAVARTASAAATRAWWEGRRS